MARTMTENHIHVVVPGPDGLKVCDETTDKLSFYGVTPVVQPSGAGQVALTDNTTGTAADALAAGVGVQTLAFFINLATLANGDILTEYTPGYKFKILS